MRRIVFRHVQLLLVVAVVAMGLWTVRSDGAPAAGVSPEATPGPAPSPLPEEEAYRSAAAAAWTFIDRNTVPATGLVRATEAYEHITIWDIGSILGALHSAEGLGFVDGAEFDRRMGRVLETINGLDLYEGAVYNRSYSATSGRMVDRRDQPSSQGVGWSTTDLGRFLVWLRIVADAHPQHREAAAAAAERIDFSRILEGGYLHGEDRLRGDRPRRFQEGRVGYEQYVARGFAAWGHPPEKALALSTNARPVEVMGHTLVADGRGDDRLTGEPFFLMGMELGWSPAMRDLAWRVLAAQEERYRETGQVTMVSEDAVHRPPHYFYYYNVYGAEGPFSVDVPGSMSGEPPRWVSAKAAYGWHALLPSEYTWLALRTVDPARSERGWSSGVYEGSGRSTETRNVNTAAIILESALFRERGRPFLDPGRPGR